ncbi:MAG TPA: peptide ligase PGM1-related protein [Acidimicrobiia bacterium]|nr:peptide ligase PGM1-related protein [Acidimicrobiia bacterium]
MEIDYAVPASPPHAQQRFELLQERLVPLWKSIQSFNHDPQTIVVVPSMSLDSLEGSSLSMQPYEERYLFLLLLLRQPRARLVYVTSQPILPSVIDYYLDLLPGVIPSHARQRLFTIPVLDGTEKPLSVKLLERPRLMERIRALIPDPTRAHLVPYNTTELERDLAVRLGIPMYGADPRHFPLGTKSGARRLFEEEGVRYPLGVENVASIDDVVDAIIGLRARQPSTSRVLVKLNEGVSGEGNARVELQDAPAPASPTERDAVARAVGAMKFELAGATYAAYADKLVERGGVVEEIIEGEDFRSPSVQLRVTPLGEVELLSTHDQLLGGPSGQTYLGCVFPADHEYASAITREAAKIGRRLAAEGVIGRFALDFVAVRKDGGGWDTYAIELNLRKGGTTHPFLTLQFLTDGTYDSETATFLAPSGKEKYFVASDKVVSPIYRGLTPDDLFDIVVRHCLHFDQSRQTGVVLHMMAELTEAGHLGLTAVGDSRAEAQEIYDRAIAALDTEAAEAMRERPLP